MSEPAVRVEATGETVGEARWAALHELERRYPALDRDLVEFAVVSEGQRGLLGVGYEPARVVAVLADEPPAATEAPAPPAREPIGPAPDDSEAAGLVRELLGRVVHGLGIDADVDIEEASGRVTGTVSGGDLGLLIGRHGQTIDAIQYLANAVVHRRQAEPVEVVVDAEGYRERRERALCGVADRAAAEAMRSGRPVALEPMTSVERKIVHLYLQEMDGVATSSEGVEPNRHVIVLPEDDPAQV
ncbi:MAG TPA: RNA-binding cell elongation regulator Jag/EloR [Gaiellales bacterium]|nr:RNA-binding cell elongation regulator Jag/EloR [Gaiellales bacterium]